jgi:enoyl-CoA hydratase
MMRAILGKTSITIFLIPLVLSWLYKKYVRSQRRKFQPSKEWKTIKTERMDRVIVVRLSNPPYHLINHQMVLELTELVDLVDGDDSVGAVVLTGIESDVFMSHYDVEEIMSMSKNSPPLGEFLANVAIRYVEWTLTFFPFMKPVLNLTPSSGVITILELQDLSLRMGSSGVAFIAAMGSTAGGGLELAMSCDIRVMSNVAEIAQPEVLLGFPPGDGGTQRLTRLVGASRALEVMLTGRLITQREAVEWGLVHKVVPSEELVSAAVEIATLLSKRSKPAVSVIKRCVNEGGSYSLREGLKIEQSGFVGMLSVPSTVAAMEAYVSRIKTTGTLPALDEDSRVKLLAGTFSEFT